LLVNDLESLAFHKRLRRMFGKASGYPCVDCGKDARDWSHTTGTERWDVENYRPRCRSCHMRYDWETGARSMDEGQRKMRQDIMNRVRPKDLRGERSGRAVLNEDEVRAIRARYAEGGISQAELGEQYGVTQVMISLIVRRKSWKHI
jgi:hypothetical protein